MINFENPLAFLLLLLIPILYLLRYLKIFSTITFPLILGDWNGQNFKWNSGLRSLLSGFVHFMLVCAYVFCVCAFAGPVIHIQEKIYTSRGSDILFVVDVSPSMAAMDIGGLKRIDAAKNAVKILADENYGYSVGLIEMAKDSALVIPPTMDRNIFYQKLNSVILGEQGDGTAIGTGLCSGILHLSSSKSPKKCIVLITDGENNAGEIHPYTAARLAKEKKIDLYVLGIGTKGTVPLEYVDPKTEKVYSSYLESDYNTAALAQLAQEGDGKFYSIENLSSLSDAIQSIVKNEGTIQSYHIKNHNINFYSYCLLISIILIISAWFIRRIILKEIL